MATANGWFGFQLPAEMTRQEAIEALEDALDCLKQYHAYGEKMCEFGRGPSITGKQGHSIGCVMGAADAAIDALKVE